jgi:preprotein translocase subunit SecB
MSDETVENGNEAAEAENTRPVMPLVVNLQYVKDLSFENPNAPRILTGATEQPKIDLQVDLQAQGLADNVAEVQMRLRAEATIGEATAFIAELVYAGVFTLPPGMPQDQQRALLLIEGPRLLFPFARQIIADVTSQGGFPPLLLQPLDFVDLYRRQVLGQQAQMGETQGNA